MRQRRTGIVSGLEILLWTACVLALGSAFWMQADALFFQWRAERALDRQESRSAATPARGAPDDAVLDGAPIARLVIPRLDLSVVVAEGTTDDVLRRAVGRLESSARPGEEGNMVLAGHRDTFFRPLEQVRVGDRVILESSVGRQAYQVEWTRVVWPDETSVLEPNREAELTLVTCYPFRYVGSAPKRFVVRASALDDHS